MLRILALVGLPAVLWAQTGRVPANGARAPGLQAVSLSLGVEASAGIEPSFPAGMEARALAATPPALPPEEPAQPAIAPRLEPVASPEALPGTPIRGPPAAVAAGEPARDQESPGPRPAVELLESLAAPEPGATQASGERLPAAFDGGRPLRILVAAAEAVPFMKTGGLADVVDDVSRGLVRRGHQVTVVLPKYGRIDAAGQGFKRVPGAFAVPVAGRVETARLWRAERDKVEVLLVEHDHFFARDGPYGDRGGDYKDNDERFIFLSRAAIEAARFLDRKPDVIHAHDWHTALIPALLKLAHAADPFFAGVKTVLTIHNIAFQGVFPAATLLKAGFSWSDFTMDKLEYYGAFSFLKAGLAFADAITTVSPSYARQIQTPEFGYGLDGLLRHRARDLRGILNGIDPAVYDPGQDPDIAFRYGAEDAARGKAANKAEAQARAGFARDPGAPLLVVPARLTRQKGIDLVLEALPELVRLGVQVIVSGSGERDLEEGLRELARRHPEGVFVHPFDERFVRLLYAAGDFLLLPSRFEPCGLAQLIAMRYGTLPIVTRTGGLADTVTDLREHPESGNGYFLREFGADALKEAVLAALGRYRSPELLDRDRRRAMSEDFSWERSLDAYVELYRSLLR